MTALCFFGVALGQNHHDNATQSPAAHAPVSEPGANPTASSIPVAALPSMQRSIPRRIRIPNLQIDAPISQVGLNADGTAEIPPLSERNLAGWFKFGASPGEFGAAVLFGHFDTKNTAAVFYEIRRLQRGDTVEIDRSDGSTIVFTVDSNSQYAKTAFPSKEIYRQFDYSQLWLITCGGDFDRRKGSYADNTVIGARMTEVQ